MSEKGKVIKFMDTLINTKKKKKKKKIQFQFNLFIRFIWYCFCCEFFGVKLRKYLKIYCRVFKYLKQILEAAFRNLSDFKIS